MLEYVDFSDDNDYSNNPWMFSAENQNWDDETLRQLKEEYDNCLVRLYDENDLSLQSNIDDLNSYFASTYKLSVLYNDYTSGFSYIYNQNQMYYYVAF